MQGDTPIGDDPNHRPYIQPWVRGNLEELEQLSGASIRHRLVSTESKTFKNVK